MSFEWNDYLLLAKKIASNAPDSEPLLRTAVSRAYYAAFHHSREYAVQHLSYPARKQGGDHAALAQKFKNCLSSIDMQEVGDLLRDAREWRNKCDYDIAVHDVPSVLRRTLTCVNNLYEILERNSTKQEHTH